MALNKELINPNDETIQSQIARYYSELDQCSVADSYAETVLKKSPTDPYIFYSLSLVSLNCKRFSEAENLFTVTTGEEIRKFQTYPEAMKYAWTLAVKTGQFIHDPIARTIWHMPCDLDITFLTRDFDGKTTWAISRDDNYRCFETRDEGWPFFDEAVEKSRTDRGRDLSLPELMEDYVPAESPVQ